jgi:alkanesulfonate monooxygenase SsuD/methylene tetrahydromethanopterin reductase-like flavin-dependent oxidoreductase (luciferase family)
VAAFLGLPYAFAYFFNDGAGVEQALSIYRQNFKPSALLDGPLATICVWALAADTAAQARLLATAREHWRIGFEKGVRAPLASPQAAAAYPYTPAERARIEELRADALVGTGFEVAARLKALAARLELEEMVINTWTFDPEARRHSYVLLAEAFGLSGAHACSTPA